MNPSILSGDVFPTNNYGPVKVLVYSHSSHVLVRFLNTGNLKITTSGSIYNGRLADKEYRATLDDNQAYKEVRHKVRKYVKGAVFDSLAGEFEILERVGRVRWKIRFLKTGGIIECSHKEMASGRLLDHLVPTLCGVGYLGIGPYKTNKGRKPTNQYNAWRNMIIKCYEQKRGTVCEEWHDYQKFSEWWIKNCPEDAKRRVLYCKGAVYCDENCVFITRSELIKITHEKRKAV